MFHDIPEAVLMRMRALEAADARDRQDGTPRMARLRQIPPETGRLLAILAAGAPAGQLLEVGTSAGYSSMWLALASKERGDRLKTFELLEEKVRLAEQTFRVSGLAAHVELVHGDALEHVADCRPVAFCFMDAEKELYRAFYEAVVPNLVRGGLFVADNVISHAAQLAAFVEHAASDRRVDSVVVPIGKGVLVCRRV